MKKEARLLSYVMFAVPAAVFLYLCYYFNVTQDDAFITFRYAENFLSGHGLVWNIGERVEGYTNFFWLLLIILGKQVGIFYLTAAKTLAIVSSLGTIWLAYRIMLLEIRLDKGQGRIVVALALAVTLALATNYAFVYWAVAGLETALFAFLTLLSLYLYQKKSFALGPALALATLTRPEGVLLALFFIAFGVFETKKFPRFELTATLVAVVTLVPYAIFKLAYFGYLAPNPFYAKTVWDFDQVLNGLSYYWEFLKSYAVLGLVPFFILLWFRELPNFAKLLFVFFLCYSLYIIFIGGDVLKMSRFFLPLLAPLYISFVAAVYAVTRSHLVRYAAVAILLAYQLIVPYDSAYSARALERGLYVQTGEVIQQLRQIDKTKFSVATSTIGLPGLMLVGHNVYDMVGLVDSTIARHPQEPIPGMKTTWRERKYNAEYILSRNPDYIFFSTGAKPSSPGERALFLYPEFLDNYRTVSFFSKSANREVEVYRRLPDADSIIMDSLAPVYTADFPQKFHDALTAMSKDDFQRALVLLDSARRLGPQPAYPPLYYYAGAALASLGKQVESYQAVKQALALDSNLYLANAVLYQTLYQDKRLRARALEYREQAKRLAPWNIPRLDLQAGYKGPE